MPPTKFAARLPLIGKAVIALAIFSAGYYFPLFKLPGTAPAAAEGAASAPAAAGSRPAR